MAGGVHPVPPAAGGQGLQTQTFAGAQQQQQQQQQEAVPGVAMPSAPQQHPIVALRGTPNKKAKQILGYTTQGALSGRGPGAAAAAAAAGLGHVVFGRFSGDGGGRASADGGGEDGGVPLPFSRPPGLDQPQPAQQQQQQDLQGREDKIQLQHMLMQQEQQRQLQQQRQQRHQQQRQQDDDCIDLTSD
jgi:hypothetical protein